MTKGRISALAASLALATGLFWAKVLIAPRVSEAATTASIDSEQMMLAIPKNLPEFDDRHQRHMGVLDLLKPMP